MKPIRPIAMIIAFFALPMAAFAAGEGYGETITHRMTILVLELAVIV